MDRLPDHDFLHRKYAPGFFGLLANRVIDQIVESGTEAARAAGIAAPVRTFSTLVLLAQAEMSVTELAQRLGVTHAGVIKNTRALIDAGLVTRGQDARDARRKPLRLTPAGEAEFARIDGFMRETAEIYNELFAAVGMDLHAGLSRLEAELAREGFAERFARRAGAA